MHLAMVYTIALLTVKNTIVSDHHQEFFTVYTATVYTIALCAVKKS